MKKFKIIISTFFTVTVIVLCIIGINTTSIMADPTPGYHETQKICRNGKIVMRCDYEGPGCNVSGQKFCDEIDT